MTKKMTTIQFIEKARNIHGDKYDYFKTNYINSRTKLVITCPKHGDFEQRASAHLLGNGCPKCAKIMTEEHKNKIQQSNLKTRGMTTEQWVARCKKVHNDFYDYSKTKYINQRTDVCIICPKHGEFLQKADSHIRGFGCPKCGYEKCRKSGLGHHNWSDEQRAKIEHTFMERYGTKRYLDSVEGKAKMAKIRSSVEFRKRMSERNSSMDVLRKMRDTCLEKYGTEYAMQNSDVFSKVRDSKLKNGTWNSSEPEEIMYKLLCDRFGADAIKRQYHDDRYLFSCDFYVQSYDLFIELNASWTHGGHWFDLNSIEDCNKLYKWHNKNSAFYEVAIKTWSFRDLIKLNTALSNNINYCVFWDNDLTDFRQWINAKELKLLVI